MKIVTVYPSFANKGGAEDMAISIGRGLNKEKNNIILHLRDQIFHKYKSSDNQFERFNLKNIKKHHKEDSIFLSHHRKTTTYLLLISRLFFRNRLRIVHIAHNPFSTLKYFSLYPKHNIAVSNAVKQNLISFFGINHDNIKVIYNGIHDYFKKDIKVARINEETINILYLGRIVPVKQQVEFVNQTKGKLADNKRIYFAGIGKDYDELVKAIGNDKHYVILGLIDTYKELYKFDYVCLFSINEGLPLSLIEGEMFGKPLITNTLPQSLEVNMNNTTGYVNESWQDITECINNLPSYKTNEYNLLSSNARINFEETFDYGKMIENYTNYIDSIEW